MAQQSVLGNDRPASTQLNKHIILKSPNSLKHFAKIIQRITILESFQENLFLGKQQVAAKFYLFIYFTLLGGNENKLSWNYLLISESASWP